MTSTDGGSTDRDPPDAPGTESAGRHPDQDPVRLTPPADPWLAEAPTSVVGDAPTMRDLGAAAEETPLADTAPYTTPVSFQSEAPYADRTPGRPDEPPRRGGRRATRWVLAVLAACALFVAGMLAIDPFRPGGDGDGDGTRGSDPNSGATAAPTPADAGQEQPPPAAAGGGPSADVTTAGQPGAGSGTEPETSAGAAAPGASGNAGGPEVVYEVTASGRRNIGRVEYTDQDGDIIRLSGIPLPWRTSFPVDGQGHPLVLIAQRKGGGDAGPVTCTITVGGKVLASTTATGRYAAPQC